MPSHDINVKISEDIVTMLLFGVICVTIVFKHVLCLMEAPVVETAFGRVRGVYEDDEYGQRYMYMGIPYAQHPLGNYFGDPVDPMPWKGILPVVSSEVKCPQRRNEQPRITGTMDCLKLHVYLPANRTSNAPLSILFWVYGGSWLYGHATRTVWGPELLLRQDIMVVTVNYRVGPFGNLCMRNRISPGNAGFKDIVKAMRWVRDNIANFGGNPNDVTLGGSSSGSIAVDYMIASPMATGLFHRAIMQSGSAFMMKCLKTYNDTHEERVIQIAQDLGFNCTHSDECLGNLLTADPINIAAVGRYEYEYIYCIEDEIPGVEPFFTENPGKIFENGNYRAVDTLTGFTDNEEPVYLNPPLNESLHSKLYDELGNFVFKDENERREIVDIVRKFYLGTLPISDETRPQLENALSDIVLAYTITRSAEFHKRQNVTIYFYEYSYVGTRDYNKYYFPHLNLTGATHVDELGYLFRQYMWREPPTPNDNLIIERMTTMWGNFIKHGNPTPATSELLPVKWEPALNGGIFYYMKINVNMSLAVDPKKESFAFWDLIYKNHAVYN